MSMILAYDWNKVSQSFKTGLQHGSIVIRDGIAYWAKGSGKYGIAQHMPLKEIKLALNKNENINLEDIIQPITEKSINLNLSNFDLAGAIVIQTAYLSWQINKLQQVINLIPLSFETQKVYQYMEKMIHYIRSVETVRSLLLNRDLVLETKKISENLLTLIAMQRNETVSMLESFMYHAEKSENESLEHYLDFIILMLNVLPKVIYLESQLCDRNKKFTLSEHILKESRHHYQVILEKYQTWSNNKIEMRIDKVFPFHKKKKLFFDVFNCPYNFSLLQTLASPALED